MPGDGGSDITRATVDISDWRFCCCRDERCWDEAVIEEREDGREWVMGGILGIVGEVCVERVYIPTSFSYALRDFNCGVEGVWEDRLVPGWE